MARKYLGDDNYARVRFLPAEAPPADARGARSSLLALAWCSSARRRAVAAAQAPRTERLDNGFTVIVRENPLAPVVAAEPAGQGRHAMGTAGDGRASRTSCTR